MVLTPTEQKLVSALRTLPKGTAEQIMVWASQLADVAGRNPVEWSDAWTEDDLREATAAALHRLEESEADSD